MIEAAVVQNNLTIVKIWRISSNTYGDSNLITISPWSRTFTETNNGLSKTHNRKSTKYSRGELIREKFDRGKFRERRDKRSKRFKQATHVYPVRGHAPHWIITDASQELAVLRAKLVSNVILNWT